MPERPKRRKNKNKRKNNKNTNTDVNKNNVEGSGTHNESCSSLTENIKETATHIEDEEEKLEITAPEISNTSNKIVKSDIAKVAEHTVDKNEVIKSSTSQIHADSNYEASVKISSQLELDKEFMEEIAKSENCPVLHENIKTNTENQAEKESKSSEEYSCSKKPLNNVNTINEQPENVSQTYIVEPPEQVDTSRTKSKLDNTKKSKSCDNDDCPTIVEITDDSNIQSDEHSLCVINNTNVLISGDESDIEWEKVHHFNLPQTQLIQGILSSDTIPLNIVHCDEIKSLSPQEEQSLRNFLHTLNLSTSPPTSNVDDIKTEIEQIINREIKYRLRNKGLSEETTFIRAGPSRSLAVIDEEGSGDSSKTSRRHSYLSDKKSDNEELEDEVFECKPTRPLRCENINSNGKNANKRLISQPCIRVDAKLKEPEISEARGDWSVKTIEKMTGAELVYLTDSSSSTSSIYDLNDDADKGEETDVSVRMITPTIEVTDTESLLSNTFLTKNDDKNISESCINDHKDVTKSTILTETVTENLNDVQNNTNVQHDTHEIVIMSTDNIKTNLFVKDINESKSATDSEKICEIDTPNLKNNSGISSLSSFNPPKDTDIYDLEIKVLKCELNNAINNLIKEVISDSESCKETSGDTITRQDSSSSIDSSQCTVKYNPNNSSLNDVSNILQEDTYDNANKGNLQINAGSSHVKDVLQCVTAKPPLISKKIEDGFCKQPSKLRDICVKKITSFPFGDKILEELAHVSLRLQNMSALVSERNQAVKTQFINKDSQINAEQCELRKLPEYKNLHHNEYSNIPPPILPRKSSLKIAQDEPIKFVPPKAEAKYECLSPSQKMLMEKTNTTFGRDFKSQPNVNINETSNGIEKKSDRPIIPSSIAPMKSETGSRLLALLRDTSISNNSNTHTLEDRNLNQIPKMKTNSETFSKRLLDEIDSANQYKEMTSTKNSFSTISSNSFKLIPSQKPKKLSTYSYESDEASDFRENSFRTMRSNKKYFHYSTGNLNKEIEDDISSIQNMHRYCTNLRDQSYEPSPRRPSLPKDLCDQQMEYICQKEKEVDAELRRLEQEQNRSRNRGPRAPMVPEQKSNYNQIFHQKSKSSINHDFTSPSQTHKNIGNSKLSSLFSRSQEELLREKMYSEYMSQMAEREQRKQQRVIKVTQTPVNNSLISKSMPLLDNFDSKVNNRIEQEFISKARERWCKLGIRDPETEDKKDVGSDLYREPKVIEHKIKVIEAGEEKDVQKLPSHMQDFVKFTVKEKEQDTGSTETVMIAPTFKARSSSPAIWRPGAPSGCEAPSAPSPGAPPPPPPPPVWTPGSATTSPLTSRKTFRPVHFEDTPPPRRKFGSSDQNGCTSGSESEGRLRTSQSAPATGLNSLGSSTSRLPRAQNPTVTLLQKAREGQIPRAPSNIQPPREENHRLARDRPSPPRGEPAYALRKDYTSESEAERSDFERSSHRMTDAKKKIEGIGPTTKDGMPVTLRSEVKDPSRWYKKMYDTIHKNKYDEDYVTIRYKNRRGETLQRPSSNRSQYAYFDPRSGYLSEPEGGLSRLASSTWSDAYDSDVTSGPRRRTASVQEDRRHDEVPAYLPNNKYSTLASARARQEVYKNQPGRIENYMPGKSSVIDKEAKQWWDEVMDIFDGQNESNALSQSQASPKEKKDITSAILSKSNMARALKESGYESDSTLIFRRREDTEAPLSPAERRAAYKDLQAGGEPPLRGFRSPAPPRQESPSRRYVESDVNIHYRCPVRHDPLPLVPERELAIQQAEHMKRLYREQRRNKYLQENNIHHADVDSFDASIKELQDMQNRRHQDNFMPSQKTVVPLNRYDEAEKIVAKALYTFNGQTARELSFRKGDIINVRRQIDSNWYEGEVRGKIGLFPYNYVELLKGDGAQTLKKPAVVEGRARAKFDFIAQTNLELPLKKGEIVVLARRIDHNWWEGRNANRTGIFPDSYVTILQEPSQSKPEPILTTDKPVASPVAHGLLNGTDKRSMGSHSYTPQPNSPALSNAPPATQPLSGYVTKSSQGASASERGYGPPTGAGVDLNNTEPLYVDTNAEAVPYRAMYKYRPQNPDELELQEGDTVYVLEKCDDGWYVGSSQRTGRFGTFPGNYVERI